MGQGNNASWPVGGATRQSGGNWVGRFEKPEDWSIWASMYSSNLELGQLITVGDAILKWTAAGVKFVDAAFATQADLDSFCSKIGTPIATGSTAMVAGVSKTFQGQGVGWQVQDQAIISPSTLAKRHNLLWAGDSIGVNFKSFGGPLAFLSGKRIAMCKNISMAGKRSDEITAALLATDLSVIGVVYYQAGTNDIAQSTPWSTTLAALNSALSYCRSNQTKMILGGIPPGVGKESKSAVMMSRLQAWANDNNIPFCDAWRKCRTADGGVVSGALSDNLHPVADRYFPAASDAWEDLTNWLWYLPPPVNTGAFLAGQYANLLPNGNANIDIGIDGTADGWFTSGGTATLVARSQSSSGKMQNLVAASSAIASIVSPTVNIGPLEQLCCADIEFAPVATCLARAWDSFSGKDYNSAWVDHPISTAYTGSILAFPNYPGIAYGAGITVTVSLDAGARVAVGSAGIIPKSVYEP